MTDYDSENSVPERDRRRFAVSANRGKSSHRIRYVETGGASVDNEECTFCQGVPVLDDEPEAEGKLDSEEKSQSEASTNAENGRPRSRPSDDNAAQTDDADSGR
jgi:hypothetical protein